MTADADLVVDADTDVNSNYFKIFGLDERYDIDADELYRAYITLQRGVHPDVCDDDSASIIANTAYRTLSDPISRAEYLLGIRGIACNGSAMPNMTLFSDIEALEDGSEHERFEAKNRLKMRLKWLCDEISRAFTEDDSPDIIVQYINETKYIRRFIKL